MIDMHCHMLPGIDDGAQSTEESLKMIRMAVKQGIKSFIATSHASSRFPASTPEAVRSLCGQIEQKACKRIDPRIHIYAGQEILYTTDLLDLLEKGKYLTLADSSWILLEFQPSVSWSVINNAVRELAMSPYHPILAHVERYHVLEKSTDYLDELIENGASLQMNYRSLSGGIFDRRAIRCRKLVRDGYIHYLATDMHNTKERAPELKETLNWMRKHLDEDTIEDLCGRNVEKQILRGMSNERISDRRNECSER